MQIDYSKILTPEEQQRIANAAMNAATTEQAVTPPQELPEIEAPQIEDVEPISVGTDEQERAAGNIPQIQSVAAPEVATTTLATQQAHAGKREMDAIQQKYENALAERESKLQAMLNARREETQKARTNAARLAQFNALGNALRTLVQPLGWAAGGAVSGVQPYDDRQYIDAYNRAIKYGDELRNIGLEEMKYQLDFANQKLGRAEKEFDYQKHRDESNKDYFARLDEKYKIDKALGDVARYEKRRDTAVSAYYTERARRISHKEPLITFKEFIDLQGLGKAYYGDWNPTEGEVQQVEEGAPQPKTKGSTEVTQPAATTTGTKPAPAVSGLNEAEARLIKDWSAYDVNKDGKIDSSEQKTYNSNRGSKPKMTNQIRNSYNRAASLPSAPKPAVSGSTNNARSLFK